MVDSRVSLARHSVLSNLPLRFVSHLLKNAKTVELPARATLFAMGDRGDGCYWVREGLLKISMSSPSGEERIIAVLGPGAIVGELAMLDDLPRAATVVAFTKCHLTFVSRADFTACRRAHPDMDGYLVSALVARLRHADEDAAATSFLKLEARIARALLTLAGHLGAEAGSGLIAISHDVRHGDVAAMAGVARETVSRTLGLWRQQGIVSTSPISRMVVHKKRLEQEAKATA